MKTNWQPVSVNNQIPHGRAKNNIVMPLHIFSLTTQFMFFFPLLYCSLPWLVVTLSVMNLSVVQWFLDMDTTGSKEKTEKRRKRAKEPEEEKWTPGWVLRLCREEGRNQGGRRMGRRVGSLFQLFPHMGVYVLWSVCVRTVHMCISAGGVEQGVIPDGHTQTDAQMTDSTH